MKILVVIPFCRADQAKAERLVEWIGELGGCDDALMVSSADSLPSKFKSKEAFHNVEFIKTPFKLEDESHPRGPNWMFETAAKHISKHDHRPWLWLEPDAVPMKRGWLQEIEKEYEDAVAAKKKILAKVTELKDPNFPKQIPCGVAVYPADAWQYYRSLSLNRNIAWDIKFADAVMPMVYRSKTIADLVNRKNPPTFAGPNALKLESIPPHVALWHQCKDDSLINALRAKLNGKPKKNVFYHSGDFGDIIYSLPVIEAMGGGDLVLGPDNRSGIQAREPINPKRFAAIEPLLKWQKYISSVTYSNILPECIDLNQARHQIAKDHEEGTKRNLSKSFLGHFNYVDQCQKWLTVQPKTVAPVVIARSPRYHNPNFDWKRILKEYEGKLVFIGFPAEHAAFVKEFGHVPYEPTKTLLEAAEVIAGAKLFIGNQSCPYSIAEGLKMPSILEDFPSIPNCYFHRKDVIHGTPERLPEIKSPPKIAKITKKDTLIIRGPVDSFSGFGQIIRQIIEGMNARGWNTKIAPTLITAGTQGDVPDMPKEFKELMVSPDTPGQVIISMHCGLPHLIQGGEVVMTMWESTRISPDTCKVLNATRRVIVPTEWGATSFNACGVNAPISIVPLGVDTKIYKPKRFPKNKPFTFGCAGRVAHGGMRKGIDDVIKAFLIAFKHETDVRLEIKCFIDCKFEVPEDDPRFRINRSFLPDLASWYGGLNCFVSASRGEGWGLQPHQAMAVGRPVIAPRFSGLSEFFDDSVGWPVKYDLVNAGGYYEGKGVWAEVDINDMAAKMRYAFENHEEVVAKGMSASVRATKFSVENMVDKFEEALRKGGVI